MDAINALALLPQKSAPSMPTIFVCESGRGHLAEATLLTRRKKRSRALALIASYELP
jgi:hypothetical protein